LSTKGMNRTITATARITDLPIEDKPEDLVCSESPDKQHHYEVSASQNLVYIKNGSMTCYHCVFCGKHKDKTVMYAEPDPLTLPTDKFFDD